MCGILGTISYKQPINPDLFDSMRDTMVHRGPDGYGSTFFKDRTVALGHRRLSIIDLSEAGHQPMANEDKSIWLTFNGEIYNFKKLRKELLQTGHVFKSETDSEVLIHGYEQWGLDGLLAKLKGMFAFGLWDSPKNKMFVVRDRYGIKPIHYYEDERQFIFASEMKAITADPLVKKEMRPEALCEYFTYSYIPHPNSVWKHIKKLRPAHYITVDMASGNVATKKYWTPQPGYKRISEQEAIEEVDHLLAKAVEEHMVSDVPVGVFLSGGYDSTAILKYMRQTGYKADAFSLGFKDSNRSEHNAAADIADMLQASFHQKLLSYDTDLFPLIYELVEHYDEPFAVSSQLTYYHISKLAAQSHKVVLSGDGGDEMFAGYTWYRSMTDQQTSLRKIARRIAKVILRRVSMHEQTIRHYAKQMTGVDYIRNKNILSDALNKDLGNQNFEYFDDHFPDDGHLIKKIQYMDIHTFMLDNCLQRADMSSMLHSLEVRVPFLDHEVYEFIYGLHPDVYFNKNQPKKLLYENLKKTVSDEILNRPKSGFGFQHRETLTQQKYIDFINTGELRKTGILSNKVDKQSLNGEMAFHLIFLEQWLRIYY